MLHVIKSIGAELLQILLQAEDHATHCECPQVAKGAMEHRSIYNCANRC